MPLSQRNDPHVRAADAYAHRTGGTSGQMSVMRRPRDGLSRAHRPVSRDRSSMACPVPPSRRRTGRTACPARRSASSRWRCGNRAGDWRPAPAIAGRAPAVARARRRPAGVAAPRAARQPVPPAPARRPRGRRWPIGDGRAGRSRRWAFPTIAFFDTPRRRPISAVEWPSAHSSLRRTIVSSVHSILWPLPLIYPPDMV
jgi:hypothetical protein